MVDSILDMKQGLTKKTRAYVHIFYYLKKHLRIVHIQLFCSDVLDFLRCEFSETPLTSNCVQLRLKVLKNERRIIRC
jgi:hypothetical protein